MSLDHGFLSTNSGNGTSLAKFTAHTENTTGLETLGTTTPPTSRDEVLELAEAEHRATPPTSRDEVLELAEAEHRATPSTLRDEVPELAEAEHRGHDLSSTWLPRTGCLQLEQKADFFDAKRLAFLRSSVLGNLWGARFLSTVDSAIPNMHSLRAQSISPLVRPGPGLGAGAPTPSDSEAAIISLLGPTAGLAQPRSSTGGPGGSHGHHHDVST
jgi:hypothetical protein